MLKQGWRRDMAWILAKRKYMAEHARNAADRLRTIESMEKSLGLDTPIRIDVQHGGAVGVWVGGDGARTRRGGKGLGGRGGTAEKGWGVPSTLSPILPICRIVHRNWRDIPVRYCYVHRFHLLSTPMLR
jgi:hypothetical protein